MRKLNRRCGRLALAGAAAAALFAVGSAQAANQTWSGAGPDGNFTSTGNWAASAVPGLTTATSGSGDVATFANAVNTTVSVDAARSLGGLVFNSGAGAFTFSSGAFYFTSSGTATAGDDILLNSGVGNNILINSSITAYKSTAGSGFGFTNESTAATLTVAGAVTGASVAGANQLNLLGAGNGTISGVISNGAAGAMTLQKAGAGTWTLSGANAYTGPTLISDGKLILDFSGPSSPTGATGIINNATTNTWTFGGTVGSRTLAIAGKQDTANTQALVGTLNLSVGASHLDLSTSGTGTLAVSFGSATTARGTGATMDITAPAGTSLTTAIANGANGIIWGPLTINKTSFVTNSSGNLVAFSNYTNSTATSIGGQNSVTDVVGNVTLSTASQFGGLSLRFNTAAPTTITMTNTGGQVAIGAGQAAGALLVTPNVGANLTRITGGMLAGISSRDLPILQNNTSGDLQIDSVITSSNNNGMGLTKSGAGKMILTGTNTYNSTTYLNEGTTVVTADATIGNTQSLTTTAGSATITGVDTTGLFAGQRVTGANIPGTTSGLWISSISGSTITLSSGTGVLAGTANVTFSNSGPLGTVGLSGGTSAVNIGAGATLQIGNGGNTGTLTSRQGVNSSGTVIFNRGNDFVVSTYVYGPGSVVHASAGTTTIQVTEFYTGSTAINSGTVIVNGTPAPAQSGKAGTRVQTNPVITGMDPLVVANLRVGQPISGSGISPGAVIASIDSTTQITMSAGATSNNTSVNLVFGAGSDLGTGAVSVAGGAKLGGSGTIGGATTITGSLRPGNSIGTLSVTNDVTWNSGDAWQFELGTAAADLATASTAPSTANDRLNITGAGNDLIKGTGSVFAFDFAATGEAGWYKLIDWDSTTTFSDGDFTATNLGAGLSATFTVDAGTTALYAQVTAVPEPTSLGLIGLAATGFLARRRRK